MQQPSEACGGPQFQGQSILPPRPIERLPEVILGCRRRSGVGQEQKLALDAQQLRKQPTCVGVIGTFNCLLGGGESVSGLPGAGKTRRQFIEQ